MCSKKDCPTGLPGVFPHGRYSSYCHLCNRLVQALNKSQNQGRPTPSFAEGAALVPKDMRCPCCNVEMALHKDIAGLKRVMSLQHWQDGRIGWICQSCNARMRSTEEIPMSGLHRCCKCGEHKPYDAFSKDAGKGKYMGLASMCKDCHKAWNQVNKEVVAQRNARYYADNREKVLASKRRPP